LDVTIVKRSEEKGFQLLKWRWIVERTFGWWNWERRLSKDYERMMDSSKAWINLTMITYMARRIAKAL
jgi:putative transposase